MQRENVNSKRRFFLIGAFIILIAFIGFGYAQLDTTLSIRGDTKISKVGWLVHFKNIQVTEGSFLNDGDNTAVIVDADDTKVTYTVSLKEPGQFYEFTVDIVNDGTLTAKLNDRRETGTNITDLPYIEYTVTDLPAVGTELLVGEANKKTVKIRVEYPADIRPAELPTEDFTFTKTIELDYVQSR